MGFYCQGCKNQFYYNQFLQKVIQEALERVKGTEVNNRLDLKEILTQEYKPED